MHDDTLAAFYSSADRVGVLTLNRPDNRNSMTPELLGAFVEALAKAKADPEARVLVITGRGRCFSAGADFHSSIQSDNERLAPHERSYAIYEPFLSVLDVEVPVIGALNGHAVGGGFGLSLLCDIRIANREAKYGANFTRLGIHPGLGISYMLPRLVGISKAAEMLFTGQLILGDEAERIGLVSQAVAGDMVLSRAMDTARAIAAAAPTAVRLTKRTLYEGLEWQVRRAAHREALAQAITLESEEFREGVSALLAKREPEF